MAAAISLPVPALEEDVVELFDEFRAPLLRYLPALGLGIHDGEEVVQEVFLALFRHLRGGGNRDNLRGWLFRVGHNLGLKQRQRRRLPEPLAEIYADPGPDPEEQAASAERQARLHAVMQALPERDRGVCPCGQRA